MATQFTVEIDWNHNGTWIDETSRVWHVKTWAGFERPGDPVAGMGRCTLVLDNSTRRFSPGNTGSSLYGKLLPRRPVQVKATSGGTTWTLFRGMIERIVPDAGEWGGETCTIECVDAVALLVKQQVSVADQSSYAVDDAVSDLVALAYTPPATDYHDNGDLLTHYGRPWNPEQTTVLQALRAVCEAVYGRFFIARDGTATYRTRGDLEVSSVAAAVTLSGAALADLDITLDVNAVVNLAQVTIYPPETVSTEQTLWKARTVLRLPPLSTRVLYAPFADENGLRCGAVDVVTPVATTDYLVNDKSDGSGYNYTTSPSFSISTVTEATRMKITLTSTATGMLYLTLLQVRGKPLKVYDPVVIEQSDAASQAAYEKRVQVYDLPMQADDLFALALAQYVIGRFKDPALVANRLLVQGRDTLGGVNLFSLGLMDKVVITDTETGMSALGHWIRAVEYDISSGAFVLTLHLERADDRKYGILDKTGYGELDSSARLGF